MTGVAVLVTGAMGIVLAVWVALFLRLTRDGRHARPPWWRRIKLPLRRVVPTHVGVNRQSDRLWPPGGSPPHARGGPGHKALRWGMTLEAVRPKLPLRIGQRVTRVSGDARRRSMRTPGLPGLRRLGVRSRPHRRLAPGDAQTVVWLRGLSTAHPAWQAHALAARIAALSVLLAAAGPPRFMAPAWAAQTARALAAQHLGSA